MMIEIRKKDEEVYVSRVLRESLVPSKNRLTAILNQKNQSLSWESNPACADRIASLYRLHHHQCQVRDT